MDYQSEVDVITEDAREKKWNRWCKEVEEVGDTAVFRKGKKLSAEQVKQIKNDTGSYRAKAKKYKLSLGTISKIMNDKY